MLVNEQQVRSLGLPSHIQATDTWKPLPHGQVLDLIEVALNESGLEIARDDSGSARKRFTLVDKGAKMYATLPLTSRIDDESRLMIGIANSYNKTLAARIGFGSEVFVCTNGAFFAEKVIGKKHTKNILAVLPAEIKAALGQTKTYVEQQRTFFSRLREVQLTSKDANDLIVRAALDHETITNGEIVHVANEYRKPRHAEFEPRTAWSLFNAFTEVSKGTQGTNGNLHSERTVRLSGMFADEFAPDLQLLATRKDAAAITDEPSDN